MIGITREQVETRYTHLVNQDSCANHESRWIVPSDSGRKNALSYAITQNLDFENEVCLCVTERGIWPSSENAFLFDRFMELSFGKPEGSMDFTYYCLVFRPGDEQMFCSVFSLCLTNIWGFSITDHTGEFIIQLNHDEVFTMRAIELSVLSQWVEYLKLWS